MPFRRIPETAWSFSQLRSYSQVCTQTTHGAVHELTFQLLHGGGGGGFDHPIGRTDMLSCNGQFLCA